MFDMVEGMELSEIVRGGEASRLIEGLARGGEASSSGDVGGEGDSSGLSISSCESDMVVLAGTAALGWPRQRESCKDDSKISQGCVL